MIQLASAAGRASLENTVAPQLPALPRPDRDAMEEFLEPAGLLLAALGFPLLQPLPKTGKTAGVPDGTVGPLSGIKLFFKVPARGVDAVGSSTDEGFVVFSGSRGDAKVQDYLNPGWKDIRDSLVADGGIVVQDSAIRFTRDVLFSSPSAAAAVVCGGNRSGREVWRSDSGKMLKHLEEELLGSA